jgi:hypothetical protein
LILKSDQGTLLVGGIIFHSPFTAMTPFTLTKQQSSSNSTHTFDPSLLFGVYTLDHSAAMMNANKEYKSSQILAFQLGHSIFLFQAPK